MELRKEHWTGSDYVKLREYLYSLGDEAYAEFNRRIIPDTELIGVRIPTLRKIAKDILKGNCREFLHLEKGNIHEEVIIEGLVMAGMTVRYDEMLAYMKSFSEKISNWAQNDTVSFKGIKGYRQEMFSDILWFIENDNPWAVRYGLKILMDFYTDDEYLDRVLEITENVKSDFYYVQMMQAWLIATAFTKDRDRVMEYLRNCGISDTVFGMTVRKIRDSYKVSRGDKDLVKKLR